MIIIWEQTKRKKKYTHPSNTITCVYHISNTYEKNAQFYNGKKSLLLHNIDIITHQKCNIILPFHWPCNCGSLKIIWVFEKKIHCNILIFPNINSLNYYFFLRRVKIVFNYNVWVFDSDAARNPRFGGHITYCFSTQLETSLKY